MNDLGGDYMGKAILVMDMPQSCGKCPLFHGFYTDMTCGANNYTINYPYPKDFKPDWCPLKPLPEKEYADTGIVEVDEFAAGWNACLDEILGDGE